MHRNDEKTFAAVIYGFFQRNLLHLRWVVVLPAPPSQLGFGSVRYFDYSIIHSLKWKRETIQWWYGFQARNSIVLWFSVYTRSVLLVVVVMVLVLFGWLFSSTWFFGCCSCLVVAIVLWIQKLLYFMEWCAKKMWRRSDGKKPIQALSKSDNSLLICEERANGIVCG